MADITAALLKAILSVSARQTFAPSKLESIILSGGASKRQIDAYNMCDGMKGQSEIAKAVKLDSGNFSKTVSRWIEEGIIFRVGVGRDAKLLHVYPLKTDSSTKKFRK